MEKQALIDKLNRDLADEHAAIIRYLVHGYMEGEDTPLGASLVSISREEMWHFHWLGMIIGKLGGEPNFTPAPYPYDPTNRATILRSYIEYEEKLIPHYGGEAEKVDDPHIGGEMGLPEEMLDKLQAEVTSKYTEMLQHLRTSWVFQDDEIMGWKIMDQAMEKMKQLAHFAEDIAEDGVAPKLKPGEIDRSNAIGQALKRALEDVRTARERHLKLREDSEVRKHSGLVINLDLTVQQEEYQGAELKDWLQK
jgi:bacterioferritin